MKISDELNQRIEAYVMGLMNDADLEAFEKDIANDSDLANAVDLEKKIRAAFEKSGEDDLIRRIRNTAAEIRHETPVVSLYKKWKNVAAVAASVAFIAIAYFMLRPSNNVWNQGNLMAYVDTEFSSKSAYINDFVEEKSIRGSLEKTEQENALEEVYSIINDGEYNNAQSLTKSYLDKYPSDANGIYALAHISIKNANYIEAINQLSLLKTVDNRPLRNEVLYYYALCHFKIENGKEEAIKILEQIALDDRSEYQKEAESILSYDD